MPLDTSKAASAPAGGGRGSGRSGWPALRMGTSGTLDLDRISVKFPFVVRTGDNEASHPAFKPDAATAGRFAQMLERLAVQRAA